MSYASERARLGREPLSVVEIDIDRCTQTYGVAPCNAPALGGDQKCFNTRKTCRDAPNYSRGSQTLRFCEPRANLPAGIQMIPSVVSVSTAASRITPGKGLGQRASISITLQDHPHSDLGMDPYGAERSWKSQGTFWAKLLARNPYYQGRVLRIRRGYLTEPFDWANFETRTYVIDRIEGPDKAGRVKITAKDPLKLADNDRAKAPAASKGALTAAITASATSLSVTAGTGAGYPLGPLYLRINDEVIRYESRAGDTFNTLTRGQWGTVAADHKLGDKVQRCLWYDNYAVTDAVENLLNTWAGINLAWLDDWTPEFQRWLSTARVTRLITEPMGVTQLIDELAEQFAFYLWWDERAQLVKLKAISPPDAAIPTFTEDQLLADQTAVKDDPAQRLTQVWVYYNPKSAVAKSDPDQFRNLYIQGDLDAEGANQYGDQRIKVIKSHWIVAEALAAQLAGRMLNRYVETPRMVSFALDPKEELRTGALCKTQTRHMQDVTGASAPVLLQVLSVTEQPDRVLYEAMTSSFKGRYAFVASNTQANYSASSTSDKSSTGFIAPNSGTFADGGEPYKII